MSRHSDRGGRLPSIYWPPVAAAALLAVSMVITLMVLITPRGRPAAPETVEVAHGILAPAEAVQKTFCPVAVSYGTRVDFVNTPAEAATLARDRQKLVFLLQVSGNFEDPGFT